MACYLRAWGGQFDVDAFLAATSVSWDPVWRRGDRKRIIRRGRPAEHEDSGVTTIVSPAGELDVQVADALAFIRLHESEIRRLMASPCVTSAHLDFGVSWQRDSAAQFSRFPPELLSLVGGLGIGLEVSHYAVADETQRVENAE